MQDTPMAADGPRRLALEFTGSGSEYFRIWIVNLLLTALTLSLYHPFAKARKLAWFHANTRVGGQAMGFHGNPWKMLRGHLLIVLFGASYAISSRYSPVTAMVAIVCFALMWPALWRASLQFRLGNTSWRGLRMAFDGSLGGAYRAMLPAVLPWAAMVALSLMAPQPAAEEGQALAPTPGLAVGLVLAMLSFFALMPLALAWIKRYQHGHYVYANQRSRLEAGAGRFYVYMLKTMGVALAMGIAGGVGMAAALAGASAGGKPGFGMFIAVPVFYAGFFVVLMPYGQSRLQNLVWGSTRTQEVQCSSQLQLGPLMRLTLKNLLLMLLTLGLYWPFAAVAHARMRLEAISFELQGDIAHWSAGPTAAMQDASGDAAGDFFGIDLGL